MLSRALGSMQNFPVALMLASLLSSSSQPGILAPVIASICISSLMGSCLTAVYAITAKNKGIVNPDDAQRSPDEPATPPAPPAATQQRAVAPEPSTPSVLPNDGKLRPWIISTRKIVSTKTSSVDDDTNHEAVKARAWIEDWRTKQAEEARATVMAPEAPDVITIESVSASMKAGVSPDEADNIAEVRAWIGAWREKQVEEARATVMAPEAPDVITIESVTASMQDGVSPDEADNIAEVRDWIGAWREKQAAAQAVVAVSPAAPPAAPASRPDGAEAANVRAWIAAWRARQASAPMEPASQALEKSASRETQAPVQPKATRGKEKTASSKVSRSVSRKVKKSSTVGKPGPMSSLFPSAQATKESLAEAAKIVFTSLSNGFGNVRSGQNQGARKLADEQAAANAAEAQAWIAAWRRNQVKSVVYLDGQ